ncbi:Hypothetical protein NGAL_HAMBI2605_13890 [Neorhizobium galegae bv. orientalis]|nr:Hypothetical protein NGAL_HAMBI2605_13890 [Neorhizobium galegae bv. orientalis]CDZ62959.1 Hypothetical protein NGAL_HAMBI2566_53240 [Neorhizobium galegae bv. orientalis]CDZ69632.1 Hypothetical protein NGAL_HAMBI2610_12310 [Neorhizobium galegae bv. orientalis]
MRFIRVASKGVYADRRAIIQRARMCKLFGLETKGLRLT